MTGTSRRRFFAATAAALGAGLAYRVPRGRGRVEARAAAAMPWRERRDLYPRVWRQAIPRLTASSCGRVDLPSPNLRQGGRLARPRRQGRLDRPSRRRARASTHRRSRRRSQISEVIAPQRFSTILVGAFAAIALLASVGLYGLLAYTIAQRRKEIALRMALGADRRAVISMMIGRGARLVAIGVVIGVLV